MRLNVGVVIVVVIRKIDKAHDEARDKSGDEIRWWIHVDVNYVLASSDSEIEPKLCPTISRIEYRDIQLAGDLRTESILSKRVNTTQPNILVSSIGAKVGLLKAFRESARSSGGRVIGIDSDSSAPAGRFCDAFYEVPPLVKVNFIRTVAEICRKEKIGLAVPTREAEQERWLREDMKSASAVSTIAVSSKSCLKTCSDKMETDQWLRRSGFHSPPTKSVRELRRNFGKWDFPLRAKPRRGAGSREQTTVYERSQLESIPDSWIVQPYLSGPEYTLNAYVDASGHCRCLIPHRRLEVVDGEVNRAITVKDARLISIGRSIAEALPGAYGPLNIQVIYTSENERFNVIDINPRFGGGYPLAHAAGGRFTDWLIAETRGELARFVEDDWIDGLSMVRYRESIFEKV